MAWLVPGSFLCSRSTEASTGRASCCAHRTPSTCASNSGFRTLRMRTTVTSASGCLTYGGGVQSRAHIARAATEPQPTVGARTTLPDAWLTSVTTSSSCHGDTSAIGARRSTRMISALPAWMREGAMWTRVLRTTRTLSWATTRSPLRSCHMAFTSTFQQSLLTAVHCPCRWWTSCARSLMPGSGPTPCPAFSSRCTPSDIIASTSAVSTSSTVLPVASPQLSSPSRSRSPLCSPPSTTRPSMLGSCRLGPTSQRRT
mmetsp:Transcript_26442/g.71420  ORF Transcript_26442/g.71420 Transcript_26442/m.71420 type:complete len:257 (-) Transcript_26442:4117-4887(-)